MRQGDVDFIKIVMYGFFCFVVGIVVGNWIAK
jgi:hypothetical protein